MVFNSAAFLVFFPIVAILYFFVPVRWRRLFLLGASIYFYAYFVPSYVFILLGLIAVDYFLGRAIASRTGHSRKWLLVISIISNIGALFFFKYLNFFGENLTTLAHLLNWNYSMPILRLILPMGLSFHVFQSLSYVIEVYKGRYNPEKNFIAYALYVMFFPQLLAGPIERPGHLIPQLKLEAGFDLHRLRRGFEGILWGFFKKLVIADQIATIVNPAFASLPHDGPALIVIACLFAYQLYCDFSGYSDIAVGLALIFGVELTENFNRPFAATSIADFWRRWHISLSGWLRDYLYYPIAFSANKLTPARLYFATIITFLLIGLWHGANWTFVIMGLLHGIYIVAGTVSQKFRQKVRDTLYISRSAALSKIIQIVITFALVAISFVFFRAPDVHTALTFVGGMTNNLSHLLSPTYLANGFLRGAGLFQFTTFLVIIAILIMEFVQLRMIRSGRTYLTESFSSMKRYGLYYALGIVILLFGFFGAQNFIYFQF